MDIKALKTVIESAWEERASLTPSFAAPELKSSVKEVIQNLEHGHLRVAEPIKTGEWQVHAWIKQAVLLSFRLFENTITSNNLTHFYDKVPLRFEQASLEDFNNHKVRIVPPAHIRQGAYLGKNTVIMPSYINIGAYVGDNTLIDTWATVGSCAQIGSHVHISGGVGIGGVLEPVQASPTIIEDNCFIGARSEIVEGVIVEKNAVISMGVFIGQSTKIYDRENDTILYGRVPEGSVVVPGTLPGANGKYALQCAVIVKRVDEKTRQKVGLNELLRDAVL